MVKKILVNGITLEEANLSPLLIKINAWRSAGCSITIFGSTLLRQKIDSLNILKEFGFIELMNTCRFESRLQFIFEALKRNLRAWPFISEFRNKFDIVYSISSVLDLVLFSYFLKKSDKKIRWVTVFDNTVSIAGSGNIFVSFPAWLFFRLSLFLLKKADLIFTVSDELKDFLIEKGFDEGRIVLTGNAMEIEMMKQARKNEAYHLDALYTGRINEAKGIYDLLSVLKIVKKKYPGFQLGIMGKGDEASEARFKRKVKEIGLETNIQLLRHRIGVEKFDIIKSSKCFWFLSKGESFGISLLEAVCLGLPSLAYDLKPFRKLYKNDEVFFLKKNDTASVAAKVLEIFENEDFDNKAGRELFSQFDFTWTDIAEKEMVAMSGQTPDITGN